MVDFSKAKCPDCKAKLIVEPTKTLDTYIGECTNKNCGKAWVIIIPKEEGPWYALPAKKFGKLN